MMAAVHAGAHDIALLKIATRLTRRLNRIVRTSRRSSPPKLQRR